MHCNFDEVYGIILVYVEQDIIKIKRTYVFSGYKTDSVDQVMVIHWLHSYSIMVSNGRMPVIHLKGIEL